MNGAEAITAVLEHLKPFELEMILANRGLPSVGTEADLRDRLQATLKDQLCLYEWEAGEVPSYHAEIVGADAVMCTHDQSIYVFGGLDSERTDSHRLWKWDLQKDMGFVRVGYSIPPPDSLTSVHFAAVYGDDLWVFGPPVNGDCKVHCLNLVRMIWRERWISGADPFREANRRRALQPVPDGKRLILVGGASMDKIWFFDYTQLLWSTQTTKGGHPAWQFCHATKRGNSLFALGSLKGEETDVLEVWELNLEEWTWRRVQCEGSIPPYRIHSSAAVVDNKWIIHGGRRAGKFNVTDKTWFLDFTDFRWVRLLADGVLPQAREWHTALGLQDCMVVVGGRVDIPQLEYEPLHMPTDTMSTAVEMLWVKPSAPPLPPTGRVAMLQAVSTLFNSKRLSDVTLLVGPPGQPPTRIPAHRHVLSSNSTVWARMWDNGMLETQTCEVYIQDFQEDTIILMLRYMYGCLDELPRDHLQVVEVFKAADKYDCRGLMQECVHTFRDITQIADIAGLLLVAAERHSGELRGVCVDLGKQGLGDLVMTPSFQALVQMHPDLGMGLVRDIAEALTLPKKEGQATDDAAQDADAPPDGSASVPTAAAAPPASPPAPAPAGPGLGGVGGPGPGASAGAAACPGTPPHPSGGPAAAASPTTPIMP